MSAANYSGPAFPTGEEHGFNNGEPGMTLRDYFASKVDLAPYGVRVALESKLDRVPTMSELAEYIARIRHLEADAMLAERAK